jgi:hypothetical protein
MPSGTGAKCDDLSYSPLWRVLSTGICGKRQKACLGGNLNVWVSIYLSYILNVRVSICPPYAPYASICLGTTYPGIWVFWGEGTDYGRAGSCILMRIRGGPGAELSASRWIHAMRLRGRILCGFWEAPGRQQLDLFLLLVSHRHAGAP